MTAIEEEIFRLLGVINLTSMPQELLDRESQDSDGDNFDNFADLLDLVRSRRGCLEDVLKLIFKGLVPILTMKRGSATQHDNIAASVVEAKDQCLAFLEDLASDDYCQRETKALIYILAQHICIKTPSKAIFRAKNATTVLKLNALMDEASNGKFYDWLRKLSRHEKVNYRAFAVEITLELLTRSSNGKSNVVFSHVQYLPILQLLKFERKFTPYPLWLSSAQTDSSCRVLFEIILKRCSDVIAAVRTKALSALRDLLTGDEKRFSEAMNLFQNPRNTEESNTTASSFPHGPSRISRSSDIKRSVGSSILTVPLTPATENISLKDVNSNNQNKTRTLDRVQGDAQTSDVFLNMIIRRCTDEKVFARKAALQVLELLAKALPNVTPMCILDILREACLDPTLTIRKQGIETLTALLSCREVDDENLQLTYIDCILPCLADREASVVDKAFESLNNIIFDQLLCRTVNDNDVECRRCWLLLRLIERSPPLIRYLARFIQKFSVNQTQLSKIVKNVTNMLNEFYYKGFSFGFEVNINAAWMILAESSRLCAFSPNFTLEILLDGKLSQATTEHDVNNQTLNYLCKILSNRRPALQKVKADPLIDRLSKEITSFRVNLENIASVLNLLAALQADTREFGILCEHLLIDCTQFLSHLVYKSPTNDDVLADYHQEEIVRRLITAGEVVQLAPKSIDKQMFFILQVIIASNGLEKERSFRIAGSQGGECSEKRTLIRLSEKIRAVAVISLGKLCLYDEESAKKCVAALAFELSRPQLADDAQNNLLKNNIVIVLSDLCIRYTSLVDRHVETIGQCLRDKSPLVRKQTSTLLTNLLREDYLKWRGLLFYRFLTSLLDCNLDVRSYVEYCLVNVLLQQNPLMFFNHFLDSIFILNDSKNFRSSCDLKALSTFEGVDTRNVALGLSGKEFREKRRYLYSFMLQHFTDQQRFQTTTRICQEILGIAVDDSAGYQLSDEILYDCLTVLSCKDIKLTTLSRQHGGMAAADDDAAALDGAVGNAAVAAVAEIAKTVLWKAVKQAIIDLIIPVLVSLKHQLEAKRSPMLKHLLAYFYELTKDYKSEIDEIFSVDAQLAAEIFYDVKRFERMEKSRESHPLMDDTFTIRE